MKFYNQTSTIRIYIGSYRLGEIVSYCVTYEEDTSSGVTSGNGYPMYYTITVEYVVPNEDIKNLDIHSLDQTDVTIYLRGDKIKYKNCELSIATETLGKDGRFYRKASYKCISREVTKA